jgi:hypothetical protein
VIEAKRSLASPSVADKARDQLGRYLVERSRDSGARYVGLLTDGRDWILYRLDAEQLVETARYVLAKGGLPALGACARVLGSRVVHTDRGGRDGGC